MNACPQRQGDCGGSQSGAANSKLANSKPGATVQPTSVQSPVVSAVCQAKTGTMACGRSPLATSGPSRTVCGVQPSWGDTQRQRTAGVIVPNLDRIDPVP